MLTCDEPNTWSQFIDYIKTRCSQTAFENWLAPIKVLEISSEKVFLEIPNIFVKTYLLDNYKEELCSFLPVNNQGEPAIDFIVNELKPLPIITTEVIAPNTPSFKEAELEYELKLNNSYRFETFIEGPSNQFVKSAAVGIGNKPGRSYNPLFIHGGVGLGKTHLLHAIGHYVKENHKRLRIHCITTEGFINDLVESLRSKSVDKMKRFYRSLDLLLVDDIQFLQNRLNFEEEFCNTFETLINQNKQIVITSDKPPGQLKLSERIVARMEWGLVAHVGIPDLETRVAILQHKAEQKGLVIPSSVAFFIAEHIYGNVRQLEGAINRLTAHCRLFGKEVTEEIVEQTLRELFQIPAKQKVSVDNILKSVSTIFQVKVSDLKGTSRTKEVALARQVAMYLAKEMMNDSLMNIGTSFGKTHSTILYACKTIEYRINTDEFLRRQIMLCQRNIES
ncbi:chromosomal replication initiator protein DnaA [Candidatus Clavichlamydia salmonicola]|uniref:chromosomal replication initiator protein DnaA n=1 Tax=Candidatus Clavichlamydia salmonicola TaxID=469812 RepID=UPI001890CA20|nr:chromosomal replication initiator protein DnaA [Candidatus Clavichlamydia salmonicola]